MRGYPQKLSERTIRFVLKDKNTPYRDMVKKLGRCTLAEERAHKIVGTIYKISHGHSPDSICEFIQLGNSAYNLRGKDMLKLPKVNTTKYGIKSWKYYGPKLWNIDILGPRLPTHTWRGRHMHEDSRWRRQPGKNIRNAITNYRFLGFFDGLTTSNPLPLDFFENRPLLRRF